VRRESGKWKVESGLAPGTAAAGGIANPAIYRNIPWRAWRSWRETRFENPHAPAPIYKISSKRAGAAQDAWGYREFFSPMRDGGFNARVMFRSPSLHCNRDRAAQRSMMKGWTSREKKSRN
jgi:hypothetical protein